VRRYEHACGSEMDSDDAPFVAHRHSYAIVDFFGIVNSMGLTLGQHNWYFLLIGTSSFLASGAWYSPH